MEQVLLVVQVIVAMGLIGLVLIQRSDSDGFGLSGGSGNNLLSGRGSANAMTRITSIFAAIFIINSLALGVLAARGRAPSIAEQIEEQQAGESAIPSVPLAGAEKKKAESKPEDSAPVTKKAEKAEKKETAPAVPVEGEAKEEAPKKPAPKKKPAAEPVEDHNE